MNRPSPQRIACVGASVTFGLGLANRREQSYPAVLARLLGEGHHVRNFGHSGAAAARGSATPYWRTPAFTAATRFRPNVVIISLGINDALRENARTVTALGDDFAALVSHFRTLPTSPAVLATTPTPVFGHPAELDRAALENQVRPTLAVVAERLALPLIDFFTPLSDHPELFPDGVHPNAEGARVLAETVYTELRRAGLAKPPAT